MTFTVHYITNLFTFTKFIHYFISFTKSANGVYKIPGNRSTFEILDFRPGNSKIFV